MSAAKKFPESAERIDAAFQLSGLTYKEIAPLVGVEPETLRKNWKGYQKASEALLLSIERMAAGAAKDPRNKIKAAMRAAGKMGIHSLAKLTGYEPGVLKAVIEGNAKASERMIEGIVKALPSLSKEELMNGSEHAVMEHELGTEGTYGAKPNIKLPPGMTGRFVPLLSWVQAGQYSIGHTDGGYEHHGVLATDVDDPRAFALTVEGDSMSPKINEGDLVVVAPGWTPRSTDIVIVQTIDGEVFCKVMLKGENGRMKFVSLNEAHPAFELSADQIAWIYPVAQVTNRLRRK